MTTPAFHLPCDRLLIGIKFAVFMGLCWGNRQRYLALKGSAVRRAAQLGLYEHHNLSVLPRFVSPGDTVVDVGANVGVYSTALARLVGTTGSVIAFEPLPFFTKPLSTLFRALPQVKLEPLALGLKPCEQIEIRVPLLFGKLPEPALATIGAMALPSESISVSMTSIDQYRSSCNRISFIKIDVEGLELEVLRGGSETLRQDRPVIQLEVLPNSPAAEGLDDLAAEYSYIRAYAASGTLRELDRTSATAAHNQYLIPRERSDLLHHLA